MQIVSILQHNLMCFHYFSYETLHSPHMYPTVWSEWSKWVIYFNLPNPGCVRQCTMHILCLTFRTLWQNKGDIWTKQAAHGGATVFPGTSGPVLLCHKVQVFILNLKPGHTDVHMHMHWFFFSHLSKRSRHCRCLAQPPSRFLVRSCLDQ